MSLPPTGARHDAPSVYTLVLILSDDDLIGEFQERRVARRIVWSSIVSCSSFELKPCLSPTATRKAAHSGFVYVTFTTFASATAPRLPSTPNNSTWKHAQFELAGPQRHGAAAAVLESVARVASSALGCANPLSARFPRNHSAARRHTTRTLLCMRCRAQCIGDALSFTEAPSHRSLPAAATTLLVRCDCGSADAEMMTGLSRCREWQFCFLCPRDVARGCSFSPTAKPSPDVRARSGPRQQRYRRSSAAILVSTTSGHHP